MSEVIRFAVTGGLCFLVEFSALVFLRNTCGLDTLAAVPLAFLLSVAVNYLLCVRWVFPQAKKQRKAAQIAFLLSSLFGLALNELFMWLFRLLWGEGQPVFILFSFTVTRYMVNKCVATLLVMIWNFFSKRAILRKA